jgi:hypothetical protein
METLLGATPIGVPSFAVDAFSGAPRMEAVATADSNLVRK